MKAVVLTLALLSIGFASNADEFGATGMWINGRKNPSEPLRTGMVWTNSPAYKAGIKSGLFLIAVNGTNVVTKSPEEVSRLVRGPVGTVVTLEIADVGRTRTNKFTIKRGRAVVFNNQVVEISEAPE
jgi:C-terminal processing protease CtpA/Prc